MKMATLTSHMGDLFLVICIAVVVALGSSASSSSYPATNNGWPVCSPPAYTAEDMLDVYTVLYNCSNNIPGVQLPPSYFTVDGNSTGDVYAPTQVSVSMKFNNLISIDDITTIIQIDFYLRASWNDTRWYAPYLFSDLNPEVQTEGIDITSYVRNGDTPLPFFLPDLVFFQSIELDEMAELIKFYEGGSFYWSRHLVATFTEPQMNFRHYPLDQQNFSFVFQSFSYDSQFIELVTYGTPITFNYDPQQQMNYIDENQLWDYMHSSAYIELDPAPSPQNPTRTFSNAYFNLKFARAPLGIIYRLALPVTILLLIVGFSFWSDLEERQGVTINMLLVVAALYIVIGQVIPFVGYLSTMDVFTTTTFILLSMTVGINIIIGGLQRKQNQYPLFIFHRDLIMFVCRVLWIPMVIYMFFVTFDVNLEFIKVVMYLAAAISLTNGVLKIPKLQKSLKKSVLLLRAKEKKIKALAEALEKLQEGEEESEDDEDDDDLLSEFKDNFKIAGEEEPEETKKDTLKKEARQLKLTYIEVLVLVFTADWYNNAASLAEVFGVAGIQNMAKDMIGMKTDSKKQTNKGKNTKRDGEDVPSSSRNGDESAGTGTPENTNTNGAAAPSMEVELKSWNGGSKSNDPMNAQENPQLLHRKKDKKSEG